jgi:argininosuccinate lyase
LNGLASLKDALPFVKSDEDIHTAVERLLIRKTGGAGKKIHTGRSRNEQVALDMRLWLKKEIRSIQVRLTQLMSAALRLAARHRDCIMPAFTHLQAAQPVLFGHYMLSLFFMLERDHGRLADCYARADVMPLGSGALAGSGFPLDRRMLARVLKFARLSDNSMDAVSDRDFLAEFLSACAILMIHLSRFAEDLILFASPGYGFVTLSDAYSTGSSMMPNKKNPDSLELIRGKTGRVFGDLMALLTVLKGLPHTYDKDLQEDKEPLFDAADTVSACLSVFSGVLSTLTLNRAKIRASLEAGLLATDMADCLAGNGVPFRDAHALIGRIVRESRDKGISLSALSPARLRKYSHAFPAGYRPDFASAVRRRNLYGGTGPSSVAAQMKKARLLLRKMRSS